MAKKKTTKNEPLPKHLKNEILRLSMNSFGLVAALAWNELIKEAVEGYIKPIIGETSGIISLLIYAILVTILAVAVTYNLSKLIANEAKSKK
jgi:hypothetical protein